MATYITPLKAYRKEKISILKDFGIHLTDMQKEYLNSLENEIKIDNFCRKLISDKLSGSVVEPIKGKRNRKELN